MCRKMKHIYVFHIAYEEYIHTYANYVWRVHRHTIHKWHEDIHTYAKRTSFRLFELSDSSYPMFFELSDIRQLDWSTYFELSDGCHLTKVDRITLRRFVTRVVRYRITRKWCNGSSYPMLRISLRITRFIKCKIWSISSIEIGTPCLSDLLLR